MAEGPVRGVMFDVARLTERHEYYFDLVPHLAEWGYNAILWHFSDNEGFALKLDCAPELAGANAFSKAEMAELVKLAQAHGIEIIPELETLGHTGYILRRPEYEHLLESRKGPDHFTICPSKAETRGLMAKLIGETASLFPSKYFHVGFDEGDWGSCPLCWLRIDANPGLGGGFIYVDYLEHIRDIAAGLGKQVLIWGDYLLRNRKIIDAIPKDVVICDWHYEADVTSESADFFLDHGFKVLCVPSCLWGGNIICPATRNFDNVRAMARIAKRGALGSINTLWTSWRTLQGATVHALALGGRLLNDSECDADGFAPQFVRSYFGGRLPVEVAESLGEMYSAALGLRLALKLTPDSSDYLKPFSPAELAECGEIARKAAHVAEVLRGNAGLVERNQGHYADLVVSMEILAGVAGNADAVNAVAGGESCGALGAELEALFQKAATRWLETRHGDDPLLEAAAFRSRKVDSLTHRLKGAAAFFGELSGYHRAGSSR